MLLEIHMAVADRKLIRAINRFQILNAIRIHELIPRVDIARETGLSQASVTGITASLIKEGLLMEKDIGKSIGGRRPILLALNPDGAYTIGAYLSIQQIDVVIINFQAAILASHTLPLKKSNYSPKMLAHQITQAIHSCMWKANLSKNQISGAGIALPGLVESQTGLVHFLPNYQWRKENFRDIVQEKIDIPIYVENSANTLTIAEQWFGIGRGIDDFIVVNLEYGVGMGIVINGQLYRGNKGIAGEFGHITLDPDGPLCRCGKNGCLETYVGNNAILREAKKAAAKGEWHPENQDGITLSQVIQAAMDGDLCLKKIYANAGRYLGIGLSNLIQIFNPAKIIITGKGVEANHLLFKSMYQTISRYISGKVDDNTDIAIRNWNRTDNAKSAGVLVLQEIYKSPANRIVPII